jgi:uncharacterized protein
MTQPHDKPDQASTPSKPFNIMAKPVSGRCNLACTYCYYTCKPKDLYPDVAPGAMMMTDEILESFTRQYLEAQPIQCDFNWQGGEPMLAGLEFYRKALDYQKRYRQPNQRVGNAFQTNATLITDEWCEFFAANDVLVGVSLDGPAQWHDYFRRDHAGNGTFHKVQAGLDLLTKHQVEYNVLVTLNRINAPHAGDIYRYFVNRGIRYVQFIPILERDENGRVTEFSCTPEQFGQFNLDVYNLWASRDIGKVSERFIDSVLHAIIFNKAALCCYAQECANAHVLEFNGDLYACDHFVYEEWKIGNIMETPLVELRQDPRLAEFGALKTDLPAVCRECEYLQYCNSGCPKHHVPIGTDPERVNYFCEGYKRFFAEALEPLTGIAQYLRHGKIPPKSDPIPQAAPAPAEIPPPPTPQARPGRPRPKRNDPCPCNSGRKFKHCCGRN